MATAFAPSIKFKTLKTRNDAWQGDFWQKCKALYAGGPTLLGNRDLLKKVMPTHNGEATDVYNERLDRAFYIPYPGSIIDKLVAELMSKPLSFELENTTASAEDGGVSGSSDEEQGEQLPPYYSDLVKNCAKPGGKKQSLNQFAREQMFTALQCQTAWALVDLPKAPTGGYANRALQDKAGALNAYICSIDPECVIDWEEKDDGELAWAVIFDTITKREGVENDRNMITLRWRYFREDDWAIYEYTYDSQKSKGPQENEAIKLTQQGKHSFGRVPLRRMTLPDGLWAMGKLEAIARSHMNQRNALSWGQLKALFPVPVLYAQAPNPADPTSEDAGRVAQQHGQGFLRVFAEKDKLEYFSPDTAPYTVAQADLNNLRDEMHRVLYAMAQSVDNSGAALQRSGDSKAIDAAVGAVILRALGTFLREHLEDLLGTISQGRKDNHAFSAKGMDNFDDVTLSQLVLDAIGISTVQIQSATFQKLFKYKVAKLALGADIDESDLEKIKTELEQNVTNDVFDAENQAKVAQHQASQAVAEATAEDPIGAKQAKAEKQMTTKPKAKKAKKAK